MHRNEIELGKFHRLFYPQVPVVIAAEFEGTIGAMPAIWCMPLSFKPPLVGVAVAPEHETYRLISGARSFSVNWLEFPYANQIGDLGDVSGKELADKLSLVGHAVTRNTKTSSPVIKEASAVLECQLWERHKTGSHQLILGQVEHASASRSFGDYWDFSKYNPPLYAGTVGGEQRSWIFMSTHGETKQVPLNHQK